MSSESKICLFYLFVTTIFYVSLLSIGIVSFSATSMVTNLILYVCGWIILSSVHCLYALIKVRPEHPISYLRRHEFTPDYRERLLEAWPILLLSIIFMPAFSAMKSAIPLFNSFSWDQSFIGIDRLLHGSDPWRLLQPVIGYPVVTSALSVAYHAWILLLYVGTVYFALYVPDRSLRARYFAAFFGIWTINGVILAIIFASVGPCFIGPLLGNPYYADQMAYLHRANEAFPVMVLDIQRQLLAWQTDGSHGLGRGITAMPSMHVSLAFLFYLAVRQHSRILGWVFLLFLIAIMVGSVHLGYHYAIDGYVSIVTTAFIWTLCDRRSRAHLGRVKSILLRPLARPS